MLVALSFNLGGDAAQVMGNFGYEGVRRSNDFNGGRVELGWNLPVLGLGSADAASSSALGGIVPFVVLGVIAQRDDVNYLTRAPNQFFPTGGAKSTFYGVHTGLNLALVGDPTGSAAASSFAAFYWNVFANVGYGKATVEVDNFNFHRSATGLYYEVGTQVLWDIGRIRTGPSVVMRRFDNGPIEIDDTFFEWVFALPLR